MIIIIHIQEFTGLWWIPSTTLSVEIECFSYFFTISFINVSAISTYSSFKGSMNNIYRTTLSIESMMMMMMAIQNQNHIDCSNFKLYLSSIMIPILSFSFEKIIFFDLYTVESISISIRFLFIIVITAVMIIMMFS